MGALRVLVGVDGSPGSEAALRWALREAALWAAARRPGDGDGDERPVVTALLGWTADELPRDLPPDVKIFDHEGVARAGAQTLKRSMERVDGAPQAVELRWSVVHDEPVSALVGAAADADLIVVGERGIGQLHRATAGSVSQGVVHHAQVPVVIVRPVKEEHRGAQNAVEPAEDRRPVVVGVDGSGPSLCALRWAARAAAVRQVPLRVVHGWGGYDPLYTDVLAAAQDSLARQAREIVDHAVRVGLGDATDVAVEPVVSSESAVRALLRESAGAQLLVLGSRGLGGFARLMLGSVSHQCVLYGTSDLAVVRGRRSSSHVGQASDQD